MMGVTGRPEKTGVCDDLRREHGGNVASAISKETDYRGS